MADEKDAAARRPTEENTMLDTKGQSKATSTGGHAAEYRLNNTPGAEELVMAGGPI